MSADFPSHTELHTSTLVELGVPKGMTAMARLVGFTVGAATKALVEGGEAMEGLGVVSPTSPLFYAPILHTLEGLRVKMSDTVRVVPH
jgi:saccharopine dehydrogenase (NADP+, L-glutamate forming)